MTALRNLMAIPLLLVGLCAHAQTPPEQYFNKAAREYVKEDRITALRTLDEGLRAHPGDARMRRLAEAILKEQQQQQQSSQQQNQQQNQDQKNQDQQGQQQEPQEEQRQGNEQEQRAEEREQQQRRQQPGELSKEEAERMLDALERREQDVQNQVRSKLRPARRATIEKDW